MIDFTKTLPIHKRIHTRNSYFIYDYDYVNDCHYIFLQFAKITYIIKFALHLYMSIILISLLLQLKNKQKRSINTK